MFDLINIASTGMIVSSRNLAVIGNNVSNLNTSGFKLSQLSQFDMGYRSAGLGDGGGNARFGNGVDAQKTFVSFKAGENRETGNEFDFAIDGAGFFILQDANENRVYSRSGSFQMKDSALISKQNGMSVMYYDTHNRLQPFSLQTDEVFPAQKTSEVKLSGFGQNSGIF